MAAAEEGSFECDSGRGCGNVEIATATSKAGVAQLVGAAVRHFGRIVEIRESARLFGGSGPRNFK